MSIVYILNPVNNNQTAPGSFLLENNWYVFCEKCNNRGQRMNISNQVIFYIDFERYTSFDFHEPLSINNHPFYGIVTLGTITSGFQ